MANNLSEATISIATVIQLLSPVAVAVLGGAGWFIKRIIGKTENNIEMLQKTTADLAGRCTKAETKLKEEIARRAGELEEAVEDEMKKIRQGCADCAKERQTYREVDLNVRGKFGARLARLEAHIGITPEEGQ